ncbi:MAG: polysaccharide biosynthesis tyrosine autokinase [Cyclobacteriaceae bacterium]
MTDRQVLQMNSPNHQSGIESIDFNKLLSLTIKSLPWLVAFFIVGITTAYLTVRYTKPLFQSEAIIKLNFENEASTLGLVNNRGIDQDLNDISGEIELMLSKLFLTRVIDRLQYNVSYYKYGTYLVDERYHNSPFLVSFKILNESFFDRPIDINILDNQSFKLSFKDRDVDLGTYNFGRDIQLEGMNLLVERTSTFDQSVLGNYFFVINSVDGLLDYFEQNLVIQPENFGAKTIKIALQDHHVNKARDFVDEIAKYYLTYTRETKNAALKQKIAFLDDQIVLTQSKLSELESYFENFIIENRTTSLEQDMSKIIGVLNSLDTQQYSLRNHYLSVVDVQKQLAGSEKLLINPFLSEQLPDFISNPLQDYQRVLQERDNKLNSYNENTVVIRRMNDELDNLRPQLLDLVDKYAADISSRINELKNRRKSLESNFVELPSMGTEYEKNRSSHELYQNFMLSLRQSKMDLEITRAGTVDESVILSSASIPTAPIKPEKLLIYGIGAVIAMILSIFFVLIRYLVHNKITSVSELEKLVSVSIVGSVPIYKKEKLAITKLIIDANSKTAISESLRAIRTNLEFIKPTQDTKLITITSTISGEGKTFIAVNLGAIISSVGQRVCIVDMDMRKPKVHLALGFEQSTKGISTILSGKSTLEESLSETEIQNMSFLPAGPTPPNPSELMMSKTFNTLLEDLKAKFDLVIMDTPPVGLVTDGVLVMRKSDLQLYVLKADYSRRGFAKSIEDLQRINNFDNMTLILNGVKPEDRGYGKYGIGYGYGYYDEESSSKGLFRS